MCRLMGAVLFDGYDEVRDYDDITLKIMDLMWFGEKAQGGDGNGIAVLNKDNGINIYKSAKRCHADMDRMFNFVGDEVRNAKFVMMHTRLSTHGDSKYSINLHPFIFNDVVGAHNGIISGYRSIWKQHEDLVGQPKSQNDSEIIFALLNAMAPTLDEADVQKALKEAYGVLAITAFSRKDGNTMVLASRENPLAFYFQEDQGILWYASTPTILKDAGVIDNALLATRLNDEMIIVNYADMTWKTHNIERPSYSSRGGWSGWSDWDEDAWYNGWDNGRACGYNTGSTYRGGTQSVSRFPTYREGTASGGRKYIEQNGILRLLPPAEDTADASLDYNPDMDEFPADPNCDCQVCEDRRYIDEQTFTILYGFQGVDELVWDVDETGEWVTPCPMCNENAISIWD